MSNDLDVKGLEAAHDAVRQKLGYRHGNMVNIGGIHIDFRDLAQAAIRAYLQASAPADVSGLKTVWAVSSASGMHIGMWADEHTAWQASADYRGSTVQAFVPAIALTTFSATVARLTEERDEARLRAETFERQYHNADGVLAEVLRERDDLAVKLEAEQQHSRIVRHERDWAREVDEPAALGRAEAAEAKVTALTEALKPFALEGMTFLHGNKVMTSFLLADIYRARTALSQHGGK